MLTRARQRGMTLVEMFILVPVVSIAAITLAKAYKEYEQTQLAYTYGTALAPVYNAVSTYAANYWDNLQNNTAITLSDGTTVANIYAPTVAELKKLTSSPLPSWNDPTSNLFKASPVITLSLSPTGCVTTACDIQGLVYWSIPYKDSNGRANAYRAKQAASQISSSGGVSSYDNPSQIIALDSSWTATNPLNTAGVVGGFFSLTSSGYQIYVKQGDGRAISLRSTLSVTGTVTAAGGKVSLSSTSQGGVVSLSDTTAGSTLTLSPSSGSLSIKSGSTTVGTFSSASLSVPGSLQTGLNPTSGSACTGTQIATDSSGNILSCQSGVWAGQGNFQCWLIRINAPSYAAYSPTSYALRGLGSISSVGQFSGTISYPPVGFVYPSAGTAEVYAVDADTAWLATAGYAAGAYPGYASVYTAKLAVYSYTGC